MVHQVREMHTCTHTRAHNQSDARTRTRTRTHTRTHFFLASITQLPTASVAAGHSDVTPYSISLEMWVSRAQVWPRKVSIPFSVSVHCPGHHLMYQVNTIVLVITIVVTMTVTMAITIVDDHSNHKIELLIAVQHH